MHSTTAARLRLKAVRDVGADAQSPWRIVCSKGHLGEAKVADHARALPHEDVEALEVPVRHLPGERGGLFRS